MLLSICPSEEEELSDDYGINILDSGMSKLCISMVARDFALFLVGILARLRE